MLLTAESGGQAAAVGSLQLAVVESDAERLAEIASALADGGYRVSGYSRAAETIPALRGGQRPALLILSSATEDPSWTDLRAAAQGLGIPVLDVVEPGADARRIAERHRDSDGWVFRSVIRSELPIRVELMLARGVQRADALRQPSALPTDSRFFPLIVHDLRTPLNVIGLSLRMIDQALPRGNAELEEDLRFVEENFKQIERMLSQLSDYCRLFESDSLVQVAEFSPARLVSEVVESRSLKAGARSGAIEVDVRASCPPEASLDPLRARQAIQYALSNAMAAANGSGVRVALDGGPDRWLIEFHVDHPPPPTVKSTDLRPQLFERLCGIAAERRGMDLAIAARVSEMFGGSARLVVEPERGSTVVLDWPARIGAS